MNNGQQRKKSTTQFARTRNLINQIQERRNNSQHQRNRSASKNLHAGRKGNQSRRNKRNIRKDPAGNPQIPRRSRKGTTQVRAHGAVPIVKHTDERFKQVSKQHYRTRRKYLFGNGRDGESGIVHNYTNNFDFPEVKPPVLSTGVDEHGPHVLIMGSESLSPLTITTTLATFPTNVGDTIFYIPISPAFLSNTRMRLLMENYERWIPSKFKITYQPLGDATLSGGIVMVPLMDPDVQLSIGEQGVQKISRAMDYAGSVNFNVYNHAVCEFPDLPEDEEPYYINSGHSARFEFPYAFQVMAQTVFPPGGLETNRSIGWLKIHYEIKLYDPRLPEFSVDNAVGVAVWKDIDLASIFDVGSIADNDQVIGVIPPGFWNATDDNTDKLFILRCIETCIDFESDILTFKSPTHPTIPLVQGTILFYKVIADNAGVGGVPIVRLFTNLDNTFDETGGCTWDTGPTPGVMQFGRIEISAYDLDHIL